MNLKWVELITLLIAEKLVEVQKQQRKKKSAWPEKKKGVEIKLSDKKIN